MATLVSDRIDVRISKEQKELIKYACGLSGFKSLSEFIIFSINKEANEIIVEHNQILKSIEDKRVFMAAILNPPPPNTMLKQAHSNYQQFLKSNDTDDTSA